jgi:two-component system response regulator AtoC
MVTAIRNGSVESFTKPSEHNALVQAGDELVTPGSINDAALLDRQTGNHEGFAAAGGWSQKVESLLNRIGSSDVPVLFQGETGVGKEVLARKLHARSARAGHPFLKLNCAALPTELVESELFGYERGAFTGAFRNTAGKFEMANGGTILLDEIGDMDFKIQAKLLQVLQDREFLRLGSRVTSKVDVRVMAATHCDLEVAVAEGRFREDLFYRLDVLSIHIPPLRERPEEILPLARHFIRVHMTPGEPEIHIPPVLRAAMLGCQWPGNVRQLENVVRKYLVLRDAELVADELNRKGERRAASLAMRLKLPTEWQTPAVPPMAEPLQPQAATASSRRMDFNGRTNHSFNAVHPRGLEPLALKKVETARKTAEAEAILAALNTCLWNRKQAAAMLDIEYKALLYKMKRLGIGERDSVNSARTGQNVA